VAVSSVDLIVNAVKAINPLRQVNKESVKLGQSMTRTQRVMRNLGVVGARATRKLKDGFDRAARGARALAQKVGGLRGALVGLGLGAVTKSFVDQAAQFSQTQIRLRALAGEYGEYDQVQKLIAKNAKTFNLSLAESASQFADIFARLRPVGKSLDEIQTTFEGFNAVAIVSGTSAAGASAAFLQLSQALGSGRLQGDEFRSVSEQLPGILKLVADQMKVNVADLKKLGSEGAITADILINALAKGFDENADKIQAILEQSPAAKFKAFRNATSELSTAIGTELLPVITPLAEKATDLLKSAGGLPTPLKQAAGGVLLLGAAAAIALPAIGGLALTINSMGAAQLAALGAIVGKLVLIGGTGALIVELSKSVTEFQDLIDTGSIEDLEAEANRLESAIKGLEKPVTVGGQKLEGMGVSASVATQELTELESKLNRVRKALAQRVDTQPEQGAFDFAAIQAAIKEAETPTKKKPKEETEAERIARLAQEAATKQIATLKERSRLATALTEQEEQMLNFQLQIERAEANRAIVGDDITNDLIEQIRQTYGQVQLQQTLKDLARDRNEEEKKITEQLTEVDKMYQQIGQSISSGIVDSLMRARSATEALSGVLNSVVRQMMQLGVNSLLNAVFPGSSLFSALPRFADGGRPPVGRPSIVGERGPELFVPDRAGTIIPSGAMGAANVTVNVDASGSSVEGNADQASQLGKAIGLAVQSELIKQKRPGGLLAI
jgi:tape measure domain-containing protein